MSEREKVLYSPALRMKTGELNGVRELAQDVAAYIVPRFIVPPLSERDDTQPDLFALGSTPDVGGLLARYWVGRRAFIDVTYLIDEAGRDDIGEWLPKIFTRARGLNIRCVPLAMLHDLGKTETAAFKDSIDHQESLKFCICVSSGDMVSIEFGAALNLALEEIGLSPRDCAVIADFSDSDFSQPENVAPIISAALELLQELGEWRHIIFQGTHYPETNPATQGSSVLCPRNEWAAWRQAVRFDPTTADHMIFGDYGADSAKIVFGGAGGIAIRHYRYTTDTAWFIVRGTKTGSDKEIMQNVCNRIITSAYFADPNFSSADAYIYRTANKLDGPGNSTMWRQINTTHHITRVVTDVAKVRGISIATLSQEPASVQLSLLDL
jgi:hypothetical protein